MSKDNISLNDILEEFSPDGNKVDKKDTTITDNQPKQILVEKPKSLEQLELERLEAISKGELSDTAINYASYTNKPNKIIENPTQSSDFNPYYTKSVVKISSRPEPKESIKSTNNGMKVSDNQNSDNSDEPKKIDSRNKKAILESSNHKKDYSRSHNEISEDDFKSMSEKLRLAKAKKQRQIDELNANLKVETSNNTTSTDISTTQTNSNSATTTDKPKKIKKKKEKKVKEKSKKAEKSNVESKELSTDTKSNGKKSFLQKIVDYYTYTVEDEPLKVEEKSINIINNSTQEPTNSDEPLENTSNLENFSTNDIELNQDNQTVEDIPEEPKKKETFKEFLKDLFTSKDSTTPKKKETFKERMVDFFTVEDDDTLNNSLESNPIVDSLKTPIMNEVSSKVTNSEDTQPSGVNSTQRVAKEVDNLLNNLVGELSKEEPTPVEKITEEVQSVSPVIEEPTPVEEITEEVQTVSPVIEEPTPLEKITEEVQTVSPVIEEPTPVEKIIEEVQTVSPVIEEPTPVEKIVEDVQSVEEKSMETETVESIIPETSTNSTDIPQKKPNVFKRIKMFFLSEELNNESNSKDLEEIPLDNGDDINQTVDTVEKSVETPVTEETLPVEEKVVTSVKSSVTTPTDTPMVETVDTVEKSVETPKNTDISMENSTPISENLDNNSNNNNDNDDYITPFSEDIPDDAIDIPIEEPIKYKHFWQDPDFNPIDRIKSYIEDTSEKYKNRKRSGEIHIEIKSNPETAMLFSNYEKSLMAEEQLMKSREEFQKQVENGEYDNYNENSKKVFTDEPTFQNTSINDFNSYEDKDKVQSYISEMKTGLLVRITITTILSIVSLYMTLAHDLGLPIFSMLDTDVSPSGYLMVQSAIGLIAILTSVKSVFSGILKIFKRKADSDSFASIGIVSAFISSLVTFLMSNQLTEEKMLNIYMPIALIGLLFNLIGKSLIVKREENNFKYISKDKSKFGLFCIQDDYDAEMITKGLVEDYPITAYKRKSDFTSDFIKYTYSYDMADKFSKFAIPIISIVSLIVALISALVYSKSFGMILPIGFVSIFSMLISFCSCFSIPVYINSMLYYVSKKYARREGALLGYQAVEDFYDTNSIILSANDIFPKGSVNISAFKLYSNAKIDETLIYAISLSNKVNSILSPTLLNILDGDLSMLKEVENVYFEDGLGICGWIDNKRILMGNRELMEAHNIENLPTKSKELELVGSEKDCVYVSVSGNLALMLIVDLIPNKKVKHDLLNIQKNNLSIAIISNDFLISVNKISYLFNVDGETIKIIPHEVFDETKEYFNDKSKCSTSIVTNGDIGVLNSLLLATKKIHTKSVIGNILHAVSCILGIIIGISFITMGGFKELTATMILLYNLICTIVTLLICKYKRF